MGEVDFSPCVISKSYVWQKEHVRQPLRDEPVDEPSAAHGANRFLEDSKKSALQTNETVSSYSSRFSARLRLYGFVIGIVSGADVAHGFPVLVCRSSCCPRSCARAS